MVDDLYLRKYASTDSSRRCPCRTPGTIAHEAISDAAATLEPADAASDAGA